MSNITKSFPGILANDNITLQLKKGEIHALLGENGAGKSTLMSILFGLYKPDSGVIKKNGEIIKITGPNDATRHGIGMVHQHFMLVHNFTALENIILGAEDRKFGLLEMENARARVIELSKKYELVVDPDSYISDITVGFQQRVEILKMLYRNNEILILDEPTAVLTPQEIDELMQIMRNLANEGKSILFITHKLNEIMAAADRCTVLRKGQYIGTVNVSETNKEELSEMMVGRKVALETSKNEKEAGNVLLEARNITVKNRFTKKNVVDNVSFDVREGEIVCIAGIDGNGQTELVYALCGLVPIDGGELAFRGNNITKKSIRERAREGIAHIPEDRHKHGLILDYNLAYNLVLQKYNSEAFSRLGFLRPGAIVSYAEKLIENYDIRSGRGAKTQARSMSGGNQQKAIVAREIDRDPKLLIAVQPTRGLDVGAIEHIHKQIIGERDKGKGVLLVSLELDEVLNIADRILVIFEGRVVADLLPEDVDFRTIGLYMSGSRPSAHSMAALGGVKGE
jgi:simple sugar transport system ATP-binding protein